MNELKKNCEFARANLAHFKAPHSVPFVKELPKTATGKIQKHILSATACGRSAVSDFDVGRSAFSGLAYHSLVAP